MLNSNSSKNPVPQQAAGEAISGTMCLVYGVLLLVLTQGFLWLSTRIWHFLAN